MSLADSVSSGSSYFIAHPSDVLLYQQPDIYHDLYVYKCVLTVVLTTGDRGIGGGFSRSLEAGLEAAYAYMISSVHNNWEETIVQANDHNVTLRSLRDAPTVQILYLHLPDGASDGCGHESTNSNSLKKLYQRRIRSISTLGGGPIYTLQSLMDLIGWVLQQSDPSDIRLLDFKAPMPDDGQFHSEHADHVVSAKLLMDVIKRERIQAYLRG